MNLALFDFDGTITRGDTFSPFIRLAVEPRRMLAGCVVLGPLVVGYRLGFISARYARPIVAGFGFRGASATAVRDRGRQYAADVLPGTLRPRALERIDWHKQQGDDVVVVSASLDVYLRPWCELMDVGCICTELEERDGRLTGRYLHGDCSGVEKTRQILEKYPPSRYSVVYAYGDTNDDREMLAIADLKYYRWKEIADWTETRLPGHPRAARGTPSMSRTDD